MKNIAFSVFSLLLSNFILGQSKKNDPENIVITYNNDGTKTINYKDQMSRNPDSLNAIFLSETKENYKLKKDSVFLKSAIIGKWIFKEARRTNNKAINFLTNDSYEFKKSGIFVEISKKDTLTGSWHIDTNERSSIILHYDKPFFPIKDTNFIKYLDSASIKNLTTSSTSITISKIDKTQLQLLSSAIASSDLETGEIHYRIVFFSYTRKRI